MTVQEFRDTYLPLSEGLYRVAYGLLESRPDAEDAVQDLYIKLWGMRETLEAVHNPRAYSITLLRNLCIDRIRRASGRTAPLDEDSVAGDAGQDEVLVLRERIGRIREAFRALPENQKKVLEMRTLQNLTYEQIAARTGLSPLSLRVLLSRARKTMRQMI
ncbi:MAG: sigma-70 family RNA polymerase sigma factor [Bacteroidales bacterium]|nr:sigma-70 family RNA polymerase sigma factor [Bacteroidales bacterium]